ncbi:pyridoxal phosphate-dependent transferase [Xylariaceae sp. FL0255]|nr:pyridoxal phosphate-dependent transferase [Xylariaceae sp. FL0255]
MALRTFCNSGDWILAEEYTYPGFLSAVKAHGLKTQGVGMDCNGLISEQLDEILNSWDINRGRKPFVLYMIPTGHNPTGITQSIQRRQSIYRVAEKHDLYIIEDDPYYFLQFGPPGNELTGNSDTRPSMEQYLERLPTSYLSLDTAGRVLRLDSVSKILAPGLRYGWITASSQVIKKWIAQTELSTGPPNGLSQIIVYKLLDETWGHRGLFDWLAYLSTQYRDRRDRLIAGCQTSFPSRTCSWVIPTAGMFLWLELNAPFSLELEKKIFSKAKENGVLINRGSWFAAADGGNCVHVRLTFAAAQKNQLEEAVKRLAATLCANSISNHA